MKIVDAALLARMKEEAAGAARLRTHFNLHDNLGDAVQRVVVALEPGTYVRPHRHADGVWELFVLLDGACTVLLFTPDGTVVERVELSAAGPRMVQVPSAAWHSVVAAAPGTVVLEVKPGPYQPATDKDFAAWADREGEPGAARVLAWMAGAAIGNRAPLPAFS